MFLKHHGNVHIVCLLSLPVSFSGENFLFGIKSFAQWDLQWLSILPLFFGKYSFHFFKNRAIMKCGRNVMYTSKMWFYILYIGKNMIKIIIKQSKQIVQTKIKSQKLKKKTNKQKYNISAKMQDCIDKFRRVQAIKDLAQNYFQSFYLIRCNLQNVYMMQ